MRKSGFKPIGIAAVVLFDEASDVCTGACNACRWQLHGSDAHIRVCPQWINQGVKVR